MASQLLEETIPLDIDLRSLAAARRPDRRSHPVAASAASLPFAAHSFATILCAGLAHHLDDATLDAALQEIARVTKGRLVFVDGLRDPSRRISTFLWRYDRGEHPRSRAALVAAISRWFEIEHETVFSRFHSYILCVARPR